MTIWVGHVALCSGAVGKGATVCGLLGVQEVDTGPWGRRLAGDNWKRLCIIIYCKLNLVISISQFHSISSHFVNSHSVIDRDCR